MNGTTDLDRSVTDWLRMDANSSGSERVLTATLARVAVTSQDRLMPPWIPALPRRSMQLAWAAILVALLLTALILGAVGDRAPADPWPSGRTPELSWVPVPETSLRLLAEGPPSFDRTATRIAWVGDRFVVVDVDTATVAVSPDGLAWSVVPTDHPDRAYFDTLGANGNGASPVVSTWDGVIAVVPPGRLFWPGSPEAAIPDAQRAGAAGIGPRGIVVRTHSAIDFDAVVTRYLGAGWAEVLDRFETNDGIVTVTTTDGRDARIDIAAEGLQRGDVADRGFGWHSRNGVDWSPIAEFPPNVDAIVGTSNGFIARAFDDHYGIWQSPDGQTWRDIGEAANGELRPWRGRALLTDGVARFEAWTDVGMTPLQIGATTPADPVEGGQVTINTGPLGIVALDHGRSEVLVSPDGVRWSRRPMSPEMIAATGRAGEAALAVGTTSVLAVLWEMSPEEVPLARLWVGRPATSPPEP